MKRKRFREEQIVAVLREHEVCAHPNALHLHTGAGWVNQRSPARDGTLSRGDRSVI